MSEIVPSETTLEDDRLHPLVAIFQEMARMLDESESKEGLDHAIAQLAAWIDLASHKLNEDDLAVLASVGAILYREGWRKHATSSRG